MTAVSSGTRVLVAVLRRHVSPRTAGDPDFEPLCVRHWAACLLAHVNGKSPVELLDQRQQDVVRQFALQSNLRPANRMADALVALQSHVAVHHKLESIGCGTTVPDARRAACGV